MALGTIFLKENMPAFSDFDLDNDGTIQEPEFHQAHARRMQEMAAAGHKLKGEQLRALLGLLVLAVCIRLGYDLVVTPNDFFSVIGTADQGGH